MSPSTAVAASPAATKRASPRRVKVTLACSVCRKKKVKCNGVQPTCARCHAMGIDCQYSDPPKKRGPPKGHVEIINNRAHRIETLLGKENRWVQTYFSVAVRTNASSAAANQAVPQLPAPSTPHKPSQHEQLPHHTNALLSLVESSVTMQSKWRYAGSQETLAQPCTSSGGKNDGVPIDQALRWTRSFFKYFNVLFPILSKPHFADDLQANTDQDLTTTSLLLRYAVYALGSRYLCEHSASCSWFDKCQGLLLHLSDDNGGLNKDSGSALPTVQATSIMCWCAYLAGNLTQCNTLRRQLANCLLPHLRPCTSITTTSTSLVSDEMIRRALCVIYVMDQWLAVCTGERFHHHQDHAALPIPRLEDCQLYAIDHRQLPPTTGDGSGDDDHESFESALQIANFAEMIKLAHIVRDIQQPQQELDRALTEWLVQLPSYLEIGKETPVARALHMFYYTALILMHPPSHSMAANTMVHLAEQERDTPYLYNLFGTSLTLATSIHIDRAAKDALASQNNLDKSVRVLRRAADALQMTGASLDRLLERQCGTSGQTSPFDLVTDACATVQHNAGAQQGYIRDSQWFDFSRWLPSEVENYHHLDDSSALPPPPPPPPQLLSPVDRILATASSSASSNTNTWDFMLSPSASNNNNDLVPSPALTLATTPAESSPASYFPIASPPQQQLLSSLSAKEQAAFLRVADNNFNGTLL